MRAHWQVDPETFLTARPYLLESATGQWSRRSWKALEKQIELIMETDPESGERIIPSGQLHRLREALFRGRTEAEAEAGLIAHRYEGLKQLLANGRLFWPEPSSGAGSSRPLWRTNLLDCMDAAAVWGK